MLKLSPKIIFMIISFVILTNQAFVNGAKLKCEYITRGGWGGLEGTSYYCDIKDNGIYTDARVIIDSAEGEHLTGNTNKNVDGIHLVSIASVKSFPQNLENIYGDLIFIHITSTNLQEVKQDDIKVFPKLKCLQLYSNKITIIDANLFEFNPELTGVVLHNNQISHIDPNVFDHLNNLHTLYLSANKCKNAFTDVYSSRPEVLKRIQKIRNSECASDNVLQRQKAAREEALKITEMQRTKYEACQGNLTELAKHVTEIQENLHETQENVKTCKTSIADLNKNLYELRVQNQKLQEKIDQSKNGEEKIQELTATNEKQAKDLIELQKKLIESELLNTAKMNEFRVKHENLLQSKLELSENHNEKLRESNDKYTNLNEKLIECKDKYTNMILSKHTELNECKDEYKSLQNAKLIESEKVIEKLNKKSIDGSCMSLHYGDNQQPIILVN